MITYRKNHHLWFFLILYLSRLNSCRSYSFNIVLRIWLFLFRLFLFGLFYFWIWIRFNIFNIIENRVLFFQNILLFFLHFFLIFIEKKARSSWKRSFFFFLRKTLRFLHFFLFLSVFKRVKIVRYHLRSLSWIPSRHSIILKCFWKVLWDVRTRLTSIFIFIFRLRITLFLVCIYIFYSFLIPY